MSPAASPSHSDETRRHIIETAFKAFFSKGIKSVTMDDIAHSLSMSKRTLYQIFSDKEELLLACIQEHDKERDERHSIMAEKSQNVLEFILDLFTEEIECARDIRDDFFSEILRYPKVIAYFNQKQREREDDAVAFLEKGIEQGLFRENIKFHIVYNQLNEGINIMLRNKILATYSQHEVFQNTVLLYIRGCCTLRGIEMIDSFIERNKQYLH